jgi:hypothetical protein
MGSSLIVDGNEEHEYPAAEAAAIVLNSLRPDRKYKVSCRTSGFLRRCAVDHAIESRLSAVYLT